MKIAVIIGSTRPNRKGEAVAKWVYEQAKQNGKADFELVDLLDFNLPLLDEPLPPSASKGNYEKEHTRRWSEKVTSFDAFIFVTPEYNHSTSAALKNAIDFLYGEWADKACAFAGYGSVGAVRAVEHLRQIIGTLKMVDILPQLAFMMSTDFEQGKEFKPAERHIKSCAGMVEELIRMAEKLK